jgi:hypothetical protein
VACKNVKRRIIICKESGFRACEKTLGCGHFFELSLSQVNFIYVSYVNSIHIINIYIYIYIYQCLFFHVIIFINIDDTTQLSRVLIQVFILREITVQAIKIFVTSQLIFGVTAFGFVKCFTFMFFLV